MLRVKLLIFVITTIVIAVFISPTEISKLTIENYISYVDNTITNPHREPTDIKVEENAEKKLFLDDDGEFGKYIPILSNLYFYVEVNNKVIPIGSFFVLFSFKRLLLISMWLSRNFFISPKFKGGVTS